MFEQNPNADGPLTLVPDFEFEGKRRIYIYPLEQAKG